MTATVYDPAQWHDFFILVGTGSATLAGLVFVAMTIGLRGLVVDATHKYRAINMLTGFTSAFVISALALTGHQTHHTLGAEWLAVALLATAVNTNGYVQAFKRRSSLYALGRFRIVGGSACYVAQVVGSVVLYLGNRAGLYVSAFALVISFYFFISGSWLLVLGTLRETGAVPSETIEP